MLIIGLTGGIGSGKSTVAELFAQLGILIIDTDAVAKELVDSDAGVIKKIVTHFGIEVLDKEKHIRRSQLRKIIFANPIQRQWLEKLLHPLIVETIKQRILHQNTGYCIMVIPLLAEVAETQTLINRVLVVDAPEDLQIERTMRRDKLTEAEVKRILASQATRAQRLKVADDIIENTTDESALRVAVQRLHQRYTLLSKTKKTKQKGNLNQKEQDKK